MHPSNSSAPGSADKPERQANLTRLSSAVYHGKRLASFRRLLGIPLVFTGAIVIVLGCWSELPVERTGKVFAWVWLGLLLPMLRVLYLEWQNNRLTESLRARVFTADDSD